jgi:hypothetical protein
LEIFAVSIPNSDSRLSGIERMAFALHEKEIVLLPAFDVMFHDKKIYMCELNQSFLFLLSASFPTVLENYKLENKKQKVQIQTDKSQERHM